MVANKVAVSTVRAARSQKARDLVVDGIDEALGSEGTGPYAYERRGKNGGLTDPNLVVTTLVNSKADSSGFELEFLIKNIAKGNAEWRGGVNPPKKGGEDFYVGAIVQSGRGYSWVNSQYYTGPTHEPKNHIPRDIYGKAGEKLMEDGQFVSMIANELKDINW